MLKESSPRHLEAKTKIVILGSCKYAPYKVLLVPNPFDKKLYVEDHEKAYEDACKRFYPAIKEADVVFVYAPDGIGEHTKRDLDYAKACGKLIINTSEAEHKKQMTEFGRQNEALAVVCADLKEKNERLEGENKKLQEKVDFTEYQYDDLAYWFGKIQKDYKALEGRLKAINVEIEKIVTELDALSWSHYAIDEPTMTGERPFPRCDKYSPYALSLKAVWLRNVVSRLKGERLGVLLNPPKTEDNKK